MHCILCLTDPEELPNLPQNSLRAYYKRRGEPTGPSRREVDSLGDKALCTMPQLAIHLGCPRTRRTSLVLGDKTQTDSMALIQIRSGQLLCRGGCTKAVTRPQRGADKGKEARQVAQALAVGGCRKQGGRERNKINDAVNSNEKGPQNPHGTGRSGFLTKDTRSFLCQIRATGSKEMAAPLSPSSRSWVFPCD